MMLLLSLARSSRRPSARPCPSVHEGVGGDVLLLLLKIYDLAKPSEAEGDVAVRYLQLLSGLISAGFERAI